MAQRIVFVAPFGLGKKTTVWARILPLARELANRGFHATIVVPPWDSPEDQGRDFIDNGVQVRQLSLRGGPMLVVRRLIQEMDRLNPDIVHIVKPRAYSGLIQWIEWQRRRISLARPALILDVDDWEAAWSPIAQYRWSMARFLEWQERWGITHADGITAASRWLVDTCSKMAPDTPILYLPNGVESPEHATPSQSRKQDNSAERDCHSAGGGRDPVGPISILYFGRFIEVSPQWLATFWTSLKQRLPDARFVIAGGGLYPEIEAEIRRQLGGDEAGVKWLGYVAPDRLDQLYEDSRVAIFPAESNALNQAKCSVRLATTLMQGIPVVASAVGEQISYGKAGGAELVSFEAGPEGFAAAVEGAIRAATDRRKSAEKARKHLYDTYRWPLLADRLIDFYGRVLAGEGKEG